MKIQQDLNNKVMIKIVIKIKKKNKNLSFFDIILKNIIHILLITPLFIILFKRNYLFQVGAF